MSWTPDLIIGELRPWPDAVRVRRGNTDETMLYVPERTCRKKPGKGGYFFCSECGCNITGGWANFCPNCGARVEVDDG